MRTPDIIGSVGYQSVVQAARRSPRSVAVDEIQQEIGVRIQVS
jgi:hypothetical protein